MNLITQEHLFFVQKIKEVDLCGSKIYQLIGSEYSKPTDFIRLSYEKHNLEMCESCRRNYLKTISEIAERFTKFPYCCEQHKNLLNEKWFNIKDFANYPKLFTDKLYFTWHHILNFIDTDDWETEIIDFIEYIFSTFGSFPVNFGEPLYFKTFTEHLKLLLKGLQDYKSRTKAILEFIDSYKNPNPKNKADFNILVGIYNTWFKIFPFELSFFSHLKEHFARNIPIIAETHYNKYLNLTKATPRSKASLLDFLISITDRILVEVNTAVMYENGEIDDIEKLKLELILQKRKQKLKVGYSNKSKDSSTRYRRIVNEWFEDEVSFIKEIESTVKSISVKKDNMYSDILNACYKMQENMIFWKADENTRTKQILDLLSANYFIKDQSTYGKSEAGKKQGSVDGVVTDSAQTENFIEAFNLSSLNREVIQRHVNKIESNYDAKGILNKYLLVYCNVQDSKFESLYTGYLDYINSGLEFKFEKVKSCVRDTKYTNIKVFKSLHFREAREVSLYHILIKMPTE